MADRTSWSSLHTGEGGRGGGRGEGLQCMAWGGGDICKLVDKRDSKLIPYLKGEPSFYNSLPVVL